MLLPPSTLFRPRVLFRVLMQGRGLRRSVKSDLHRSASSVANPHGFDIHEFADPEIREFASITGILHAAKRQPRI